jgi:CubicO group peptidase (beta-lactamase class C family)
MKGKPVLIIVILFTSIFSNCLKDGDIKSIFESYIPEQLNDGWEISTPEHEGFDSDKIHRVYEKVFSEDIYPTIHSLIIVRNNKLIVEAYCRDQKERDQFHNLQSVTKSITSILMGIAIDKGFIGSVNKPIYDIIPEYFDNDIRKRNITLYHALTMQTGLDFDNDVNTEELYINAENSLEYVLSRGLIFLPGTDYHYNDGDPQLISGVIQKVTGKSEEEFALENLFNPLGIDYYQWEKHRDNTTFGAFGLWLKPRDMAKIGKLMEQNGFWDGEQIVSSEWVEESTALRIPSDYYGYYWHNIEHDTGAIYAVGHGGQYIYIVPHVNLVIVTTADPYSDMGALSEDFHIIFNDIIDAIIY